MNDQSGAGKRIIRPLPERLINKIAAGEVIERPAAVLKELVENSFDAGATRIEVIVEKSGTKLISVVDDGCGIDSSQVEVAFSRHATSKIADFDDLESLRSYGFRGEALPSIGSVSRTRMITRTPESEVGTEIIIEGGVVQNVKPAAAPVGTKVEVADLFYNTPARRKFLKGETTEARHLTRYAIGLALSRPKVGFSYSLNGRRMFSLDNSQPDLKSRVRSLLLPGNDARLFEVVSDSDIMSIRGFLTSPDKLRQNQYGLFVFINDRYIKSQTMVHAITAGYGELLPRGNYPLGVVFLDIDPVKVDVNVHPTKAEVRLSQERQVHDILYHAVKRALRETPGVSSPSLDVKGVVSPERLTASEAIRRAGAFDPEKPSVSSQAVIKELYGHSDIAPPAEAEGDRSDAAASISVPADESEKAAGEIDLDRVIFLGRLADLYLIFKCDNMLMIVDQHTAHERVLYEDTLKSIETGAATSQNLLFPANIELAPDRFLLYEDSSEVLKAAGFVAEPFGAATVLLSAVPSAVSKKSPEKVFLEVLEDIDSLRKAGRDLMKAVAQSIACRSAIMAGDRLTEQEALALLRQLLATENRNCCPHGRPTILSISKNELDGKFGRK
ncbi:MAG: DNA mismatch repair endonuclease MutL [Candidatus Zixiibacteriota bacterium]|nr:MAG: DNA mismatch repair endonuclease MutL [candidate division Zixibacteria bacterium]